MAKHVGMRLLRPAQKAQQAQKVIPLRHDPGPLPKNTVLYRKPIHPGPRLPHSAKEGLETIEHGQHIYLYNNIHTNQVVYSLKRHLNNAAALAQLPFLGKKTVPAALRKDLWTPFALCTFPSPNAGLSAYRKLREFRRLHETSYDLSIIANPANPKQLLPKKKRGKVLMNQKANSIADLAAVLLQQEAGLEQWRIDRWERVKRRIERVAKAKGVSAAKGKAAVEARLRKVDVVKEMQGVEGVKVAWMDIRDAEFAERWPEPVVHDLLGRSRYTAAWPARDVLAEREAVARTAREEEERREEAKKMGKKRGKVEEAVKEEIAAAPVEKKGWMERLFRSG